MPELHYMVDIGGRVEQIVRDFVGPGKYFVVNRARQYGKTTTLEALSRALAPSCFVVMESFEGRAGLFDSTLTCATGLLRTLAQAVRGFDGAVDATLADALAAPVDPMLAFDDLSDRITRLCETVDRPVVVLIDEVDRASDYDVFVALLGLLRKKYIQRETRQIATFHAVVLAGVHDIKNLKRRIRGGSQHSYNSPWNIAAPFTIDLSFGVANIATMLGAYEADHATGMDVPDVAGQLHHFTGGYPFLVSRLCQIIDDGPLPWTGEGVRTGVNTILHEQNTLFDDIVKNLDTHADLRTLLDDALVAGEPIPRDIYDPAVDLGLTFGLLVRDDEGTRPANIIFETVMYSYLTAWRRLREAAKTDAAKHNDFTKNGVLDLDTLLVHFAEFLSRHYHHADAAFVERQGRLLLLAYLANVVNGGGFTYVEPETRNGTRMDVVITYGGREHIVELKIWHGQHMETEAFDQLAGYLRARGQEQGWLLNFTSNKQTPRPLIRHINHQGYAITEVTAAYAAS
jgi:hypothetical protein